MELASWRITIGYKIAGLSHSDKKYKKLLLNLIFGQVVLENRCNNLVTAFDSALRFIWSDASMTSSIV